MRGDLDEQASVGRSGTSGLVGAVMSAIKRALQAVDRLQRRQSLLGFPFAVVRKFGDDRAGQHAALLAYYGFFSLFPLLLVFVTVLGLLLDGNPELEQHVLDTALAQFPVIGDQILAQVSSIQGSGVRLAVGIVGTLWGGLGVTQSAQDAMNAVWTVPYRRRPGYLPRMARGLALLVLLGGGVLTATVLAELTTVPGRGPASRILELAAALLVDFLVAIFAFQVLTATALRWRRLVPGAVVAALGWLVLQAVGGYYVNRTLREASLVYGLFALVIGLLTWLYVGARFLLFAAEVNVVLARRLWPRSLLQPPLTGPDKRVLIALAEVEEHRPGQDVEVTFSAEADRPEDD
jgi:YihY family inner membrane protein